MALLIYKLAKEMKVDLEDYWRWFKRAKKIHRNLFKAHDSANKAVQVAVAELDLWVLKHEGEDFQAGMRKRERKVEGCMKASKESLERIFKAYKSGRKKVS